ncbi:MAG: hypothetical protein B7Z08_02140 [Sphingomonadales bacterium 32-68-7]|nr:MAG: hypothetical protein B7Z33_10410 [Sphingomonadales bacterium 12-68-11]OYX10178.1 MAG: hypothetical protein B7Z08_02140 [Sphingomonadales bacterium 32-68-7]
MSSLAADLAASGGGFRPDDRFGAPLATDLRLRRPDPAESAYAEGYARGFEEGAAKAQTQAAIEAAGRAKIEVGFARLAEAETLRFEERLRETVLALCERTLAPLATDPTALSDRITRALELLRRSEDERVLRIHPDDLALIHGRLPDGVRIEPDPALERGGLRVETVEGGVEDGPAQWRRALAEALGL